MDTCIIQLHNNSNSNKNNRLTHKLNIMQLKQAYVNCDKYIIKSYI